MIFVLTVAKYCDTINPGKEIRYFGGEEMSVAYAVRAYLRENGIKQTFLSEKCGWSKQKTSAMISGRRKMSADELASICDVIGVPYDFFYQMAASK